MTYQILFVDDDKELLSALRRMLSPMRSRWRMQFCSSPADALAMMRHVPFDAVVTDMRMPEMDGAMFLAEIARAFPGCLRVILSGHAEHDSLLRSIDVAHIYLSKPCDGAVLVKALTHALDMRSYLASAELRQLVNSFRTLPVLPDTWYQLTREIESPTGSLKNAAELIEQDPFLLASILHVANSIALSMGKPASRALPALQHLGMDIVKPLILKRYLSDTYTPSSATNDAVRALWRRSERVAEWGYHYAREQHLPETQCDRIFAAGLLHLIGSAVLMINYPDRIEAVQQQCRETGASAGTVERTLFGAAGTDVGAYLLGLWSMPTPIVEAIAFADDPTYIALPLSLTMLLREAKRAVGEEE